MSESLRDLFQLLKESLARDEKMSEEIRVIYQDEEISQVPKEQVKPNMSLEELVAALKECMEDSIAAIDNSIDAGCKMSVKVKTVVKRFWI
ncbi:hypothetical protein GCK72_025706 [Caenorhabditis remanei]|uniref:Uncharacterized protein n=1 Tax=Caenorhabditis remanei TaxID=31234 RepID=A0A6A5G402_CAERE|nr:hypothetical protein GCK72_025706 [Caenorhabditis remanei]KAF1749239.1 hypothetical protein GCK72_025706 [Caenorhabditis remanei]